MSILLFKMLLKEMFRNPYAWGWGFFFVSFWLIMGAYVFSLEMPTGLPAEAYFSYTGSWFSISLVYSFSALAVGIVNSSYYSSFSLRYLTKYSTLNSKRYYAVSLISTAMFFMVFSMLLGIETFLIYSFRFETPLAPKNPVELALASVLSALFIYVLSNAIAYSVIVLKKPKLVTFASFLPLVISYPLLFLQLYLDIGYLPVFSPFNAVNSLLYRYYSGIEVPNGPLITSSQAPATIDPLCFWTSLFSWIILLSILNIILIGKQRGVSVEELRQL
jgi:hypothetical protein